MEEPTPTSHLFPVYRKHKSEVSAAFGAYGEKQNYGRTYMGIIRSTFVVGPDNRIERVYQPVRKADGHAAKVLEELRA